MNPQEALKQRDAILEESMFTLLDSPFRDTLIFQGGGALHFVYSSPRYSSDVDFVDPSIDNGLGDYARRLREAGRSYKINNVKAMPSGRGVRAKWGHEENKPLAKVEIEARAADAYDRATGKFAFLVKDPGDIYTDKIFANVSRFNQRKNGSNFPFKPDDFFDLEYITKTLGVQPVSRDRILARARAYDEEHIVTADNLTAMISLITDESKHDFFRHCLRQSMMPDVYRVMHFDTAFFDAVAGHFENYR